MVRRVRRDERVRLRLATELVSHFATLQVNHELVRAQYVTTVYHHFSSPNAKRHGCIECATRL